MLNADHLTCRFGRGDDAVVALDDVSLTLEPGMRLGLTGPSGSGKSTLARVLALLQAPDAGTVTLDGQPVDRFGVRAPRHLRRRAQLLWQSPREAVDPRTTLRAVVGQPASIIGADPNELVSRWAPHVGLTDELLTRHPHEVSEGQIQRACLARALGCEPRYLIADEPTSMLDVSTQAALLDSLARHQQHTELGVLLITHDTTLAHHWCDHVTDIRDL